MTNPLVGRMSRFIPILGVLLFGMVVSANSWEDLNPTPNPSLQVEKADDDFKIKVNVEEVRLDAVVVDRKGRQITDLTADDFEIYQDKKQQEIIGCKYISHDQAGAGQRALHSPESGQISPVPSTSLKQDVVERIIIFLVNDFSMDFGPTYSVRRGLRKFVK